MANSKTEQTFQHCASTMPQARKCYIVRMCGFLLIKIISSWVLTSHHQHRDSSGQINLIKQKDLI